MTEQDPKNDDLPLHEVNNSDGNSVMSKVYTALLSTLAGITVLSAIFVVFQTRYDSVDELLGSIAMFVLFSLFHPFFVWVGWPALTVLFFLGYRLHLSLQKVGRHNSLLFYRRLTGMVAVFLFFCAFFLGSSGLQPW